MDGKIAAMVGALVLALVFHQDDREVTTLLHFSPAQPIPWIEASAEGRRFRFVLDTGSPYPLTMSNDAVRRLGISLPTMPPAEIAGLKGHLVGTPSFDVDGKPSAIHLSASETTFATDLGGLRAGEAPADGIIGLHLLAKLRTQFDYGAGRIVFHLRPLDPFPSPGAISLPYREEGGALVVELGLPGGLSFAKIDTGASSTRIDPSKRPLLRELGSKLTAIGNLYGKLQTEELYIPSLSLAGMRLGPAAVTLQKDRNLLGNDVLSCFRFVLDPERKRILLERKTGVSPTLEGEALFGLDFVDGRAAIRTGRDVLPSGLLDGDVLLKVDGADAASFDPPSLVAAVVGVAGSTARLTVEQRGKKVEVAYRRPSAYGFVTDQKAALSGLAQARLTPEGDLLVVAIKAGRPLWKAGVRPGDRIVAIGGKTLARLSPDQMDPLLAALRTGGTALSVQRDSVPSRTIWLERL